MGRHGEPFAPRLRVTPSPVLAFLCLGLGFRFRVSGVSKNRGESFSPRLRVTPSRVRAFMCLRAFCLGALNWVPGYQGLSKNLGDRESCSHRVSASPLHRFKPFHGPAPRLRGSDSFLPPLPPCPSRRSPARRSAILPRPLQPRRCCENPARRRPRQPSACL